MREFVKGEGPTKPSSVTPPARPASIGTLPNRGNQGGTETPLEYSMLDLSAPYQEPFAIGLYGPPGAGKTKFMVSAPGKVGVVPLNRKTKQTVVTTAKLLGKEVLWPSFDLVRSSNPMKSALLPPSCDPDNKRAPLVIDILRPQPTCCARHNARWSVDRAKQAAIDLAVQCDSVGIDGWDIFCEDMLNAHFGRMERIMARDRGPYNRELIEFLGAISHRHLVLTMGRKEVWKNEKPSGTYDFAGWTHTGYHVNTLCEMKVREDYNEAKHDWRWSMDVVLCQANPALMGVPGQDLLTDDIITFPQLALRVFPESEYEDWL